MAERISQDNFDTKILQAEGVASLQPTASDRSYRSSDSPIPYC